MEQSKIIKTCPVCPHQYQWDLVFLSLSLFQIWPQKEKKYPLCLEIMPYVASKNARNLNSNLMHFGDVFWLSVCHCKACILSSFLYLFHCLHISLKLWDCLDFPAPPNRLNLVIDYLKRFICIRKSLNRFRHHLSRTGHLCLVQLEGFDVTIWTDSWLIPALNTLRLRGVLKQLLKHSLFLIGRVLMVDRWDTVGVQSLQWRPDKRSTCRPLSWHGQQGVSARICSSPAFWPVTPTCPSTQQPSKQSVSKVTTAVLLA